MNEVVPPPPVPVEHAAFAGAPGRAARSGWALVVAAVALLLVLAVGFWLHHRMQRSEQAVARRVQSAETAQRDALQQLRQTQESLRELQGRQSLLEARLAESMGQQAQMEKLYREIVQNRDEITIAEVENAIVGAAQQLQLTGNVRGALLALQDADERLGRSNQSPLIGLRRVLARDIERLRALPAIDPAGQAIKLDAVIGTIDQLPLVSSARLEAERIEAQRGSGTTLRERLSRAGGAGWDAVRNELLDLVRVRRIDRPDSMLLAPEQQYFVRENLKLRLTAARSALLARLDEPYRHDLARAVETLERDFDVRNRQVAGALSMLRALQENAARLELPLLNESLAAVRQLRGRDGR